MASNLQSSLVTTAGTSAALTAQRTLDALESSLGSLLNSAWTTAQVLPGDYRERIDGALPVVRSMLRPADGREKAVALGKLVEWVETYGVVALPADPAARYATVTRLVEQYAADLDDLPGDLLVLAVSRLIRFGHYRTLPLPGDAPLVAECRSRRQCCCRPMRY